MKKLILLTLLLLPLVAFSQFQLGYNDFDGEAAGDYSGRSVSIDSDGSHVAIGSVSYTHLTLTTNREVKISVVDVS